MLNRILVAVSALLLASTALCGVQFSDAIWSSTSATQVVISAENDWTPPVVTLGSVPTTVAGRSVTVTATAYDERSKIDPASVRIEYAPSGTSSWSPMTGCSSSGSGSNDDQLTYTCSWDTSGLSGSYQLRAGATDTAGYSATPVVVTTTVAGLGRRHGLGPGVRRDRLPQDA